ncbi:polyphosphate kinase 1 [sulfur-oxidizing endosymbiont of Gigantopelta aegis]|uniref:polyphosphate kinase 1 n=1 Tax=sulfur-oxidizing endosymbiont of Gigantopelta aegis TaxID=2794934 RepID=UPI0018DB9099|nr:polyphosphate kinase 1 [sulfur-oxidizing endosymbiont of Gigantopelta aegis]
MSPHTITALNSDDDEINLKNPEYFINRELSLLEFNRRVLDLAKNEDIPFLERLLYLCISSSNLDEFFEVRAAGVKQQINLNIPASGADNMTPEEVMKNIGLTAQELVKEQYRVLHEIILPGFEEIDVRFTRRESWNEEQAKWVKEYFENQLLPVISPLGLDPAHPFPKVMNKSLNFIVSLEGKDAFGRDSGLAVVQAPRSLPRIVSFPDDIATCEHEFIFLSSIIHTHVSMMFPGMKATGCYQFRVTRNSELFVDDEEVDDLLRALKGELPQRRFGDAVRLEVADNCPQNMIEYLLKQVNLSWDDLYQVNGPVNLERLKEVYSLVNKPALRFPFFSPGKPSALKNSNLFESIRQNDILLHHPYESFTPIVKLLQQSANDPKVLAIKQTLYRTGSDSAIVKALVDAAKAGKEVTVVIELRARFDEAANIGLATVLQKAGAHVVYGIVGLKTHAKMLLIIRREGQSIRRYAHLGTGNYHAGTARLYTDYGLLTSDPTMTEDVHKLFLQLTGLGKIVKLKKLLQSPFTLHGTMMDYIQREIDHIKVGKPARIIVKMNSLVEPQIISKLYEASQAGIKIDLIIRGVCCLRPGIKDVSENITVRSIIGRFLEHTRIFYFQNAQSTDDKFDPKTSLDSAVLLLSSADWMNRNFFKRVEACFPIEEKKLKKRLFEELQIHLEDNSQAWILDQKGQYNLIQIDETEEKFFAQKALLKAMSKLAMN